MPAEISLDTTARLLKLRVQVIGAGAFRSERDKKTGEFRAACVLPGNGEIVRLFEDDGVPMAQMHYAGGDEMSASAPLCGHDSDILPVRKDGIFVALMHNVDMMIWRCDPVTPDLGGFQAILGGAPSDMPAINVPAEVRDLVDLAVLSEEPNIVKLVETLYAQGAVLEMPDLKTPWRMPPEGRILADACAEYGDLELREAASLVIAIDEKQFSAWPAGTKPDSDGWLLNSKMSLKRWQEIAATLTGDAPAPGLH